MKKLIFIVSCLICLAVGLFIYGCGHDGGSGPAPGPVPNYTISGKVGSIVSNGVMGAAASSWSVTHVIAISANNYKFVSTPDSNGNFSIPVVKGCPYALGFYNKTGSTITLLGYLRQRDFNWHSLPLTDPIGIVTNLGTVDVNASSVEAIPSVNMDDLLSETHLDRAAANLYGQVDGVMSIFTNVDIDGNGIFDSQENKAYLLAITVGTNIGSAQGIASGEVAKMLNRFNESYYPVPNAYSFVFHAVEVGVTIPANGDRGTIRFPTPIYGANGLPRTYLIGEVWGASEGRFWNFYADQNTESLPQCELVTPEVVPSGTYTFEVGSRVYTFKNVVGAPLAAIGTTEGMIFPVFMMTTNEAGYVTRIDYKWMIKRGAGLTAEVATTTEVKAVIVDQDLNTYNAIETSPSLGVTIGSYPPPEPDPNYHAPKKISRDGNYVDVTDWHVRFSDIAMFQCGYSLNSNINLCFMFGK